MLGGGGESPGGPQTTGVQTSSHSARCTGSATSKEPVVARAWGRAHGRRLQIGAAEGTAAVFIKFEATPHAVIRQVVEEGEQRGRSFFLQLRGFGVGGRHQAGTLVRLPVHVAETGEVRGEPVPPGRLEIG